MLVPNGSGGELEEGCLRKRQRAFSWSSSIAQLTLSAMRSTFVYARADS